jgi:glycosyltransferase involved in cell wall biosynthesis
MRIGKMFRVLRFIAGQLANPNGRFLIQQFIDKNADIKRTSSGKDLVFYCGPTKFIWHPKTKGFAGSEEAIICLARELSNLNWSVTVYNNCGHTPVVDAGVTYRPFWDFNPRDKQDIVIVWKSPKLVDLDVNADKIFVDIHDAIPAQLFSGRGRIHKITRVFFKSRFQRSLFATVPEVKSAIIPNGLDFHFLEGEEQKDPYLLINTSSPDRSMSVLPKLFREVKHRVPQARLQWSYGWDLFELFGANHVEAMQWMKQTKVEMNAAGIETLGHLTAAEVGKLYQRGAILAFPTDFPENDCISVRKAQACGCVPVTTDAGALVESVQFGVKIPCNETHTANGARFYYGIEDKTAQRLWVDATVDLLTNPTKRAELAAKGAAWARQFSWPRIAARWDAILRD